MRRDEHELYYAAPARNWQEALPLGNGALGAMVYGGVATERYDLNYDQLWTGFPGVQQAGNAQDAIKRAREAAEARDYALATEILEKELYTLSSDSYQPMGALEITFKLSKAKEAGYRRTLALDTALSSVSFLIGDGI